MRTILCAMLGLMILLCAASVAAGEQMTALQAFESLMESSQEEAPGKAADDTLLEIMRGAYSEAPADPEAAEAFAGALDALRAITYRDIAAFASRQGMKMAQVRNAWFKALAGVLKADIELHPASDEEKRSAQTMLSLFLSPGEEASKAELRERLSQEGCDRVAQICSLPEAFVAFVFMDEHWDDDSWENDNAWKASAGWMDAASDGIGSIAIGSRDTLNSTLIADMQAQLIRLGYLNGKADGVFGPKTQKALVEFQLANGLSATGVYTVEVFDALNGEAAVARWCYDDAFWDSSDFATDSDTTPRRIADTPDTPDSPDSDD